MFTPYLSAFENYAAKEVGAKDDEQEYMGAVPVGTKLKNTSSIVPGGFSADLYAPGTYSTPMAHLGNTTPVPSTTSNPSIFSPISQSSSTISSNIDSNKILQTTPVEIPHFKVREKCDSVKKQAVEISNAILSE